jgi:hypothetical protein
MEKQFIEEFVCPGCARTGHATWQGEAGAPRKLAEMSDGFALRPDDSNPIMQVVVCGHCGKSQPEQLSPENTSH